MMQTFGSQTASAPETIETLTALLGVALVVALLARRLRFPYTLALAIVGLAIGLLHLAPTISLDPQVALFIFLPALLFEGAWNIEMPALLANWVVIFLLAVPGLLVALGIAALALHFGAGLPMLAALLLSAIISPTDPIAVIGLLRELGLSSRLRIIIEGESLFNDGTAVASYTIILALLVAAFQSGGHVPTGQIGAILLHGVWLMVGGPLIGIAVGYLISHALGQIEDRLIETTVTFITAYGVYLLADWAQTSGLLAVVTAGLMLGSYGRRIGISRMARDAVDSVWEFMAYVVTSLLFLLLGVHLGVTLMNQEVVPTLWATAGVLVGRAVIVYGCALPYNALARRYARQRPGRRTRGRPLPLPSAWQPLIVLSGLRGALSIALALSLPTTLPQYALYANVVYGVVLVTLLGQGIALRVLLPHWPGGAEHEHGDPRNQTASRPNV